MTYIRLLTPLLVFPALFAQNPALTYMRRQLHRQCSKLGLGFVVFDYTQAGRSNPVIKPGFGPTSVPVMSGSLAQGGMLMTMPAIRIGGVTASVQYAGLAAPAEYRFNVFVPSSLADGDQPVTASYGGLTTQTGAVITVLH
jgi:uncharacterized protein (TIGR03437 family)